MRLSLFCILLVGFLFPANAQFQLFAESQNDVCKWYVKNTSADSHKLTSVSMRFFHQTNNIVFTPSISNPGGGKYQYAGNFNSDGIYSFKYKTIQILALDTQLQPGEKALLSTTQNAGDVKDTILAAGVTIYYSDSGKPYSSQIFPGGVSPCPSTAIYISSGVSNPGIKFGSPSAPAIHTNNCEAELIAIVFDNNSLVRKAVPGQTPHCSAGRQWTTFGNAEDKMIFYSFDITTALGRLQFDTFVNAIPTMDYVAICNTKMIKMNNLNSILNSMKKIGFNYAPFDTTLGYFNLVGKKGVNPDEAAFNYCQDPDGVCFISLEHSMTAGDKTNALRDFSACYENLVQFLAKTSMSRSDNAISTIQISPNPTTNAWIVQGINANSHWQLVNNTGQVVKSGTAQTNFSVEAEQLNPGVYFLQISQSAGAITYRLLKQ